MVRRAGGCAALANSSMLLQHSKNDKKRTNDTKSLCENFDLSQQCQCKDRSQGRKKNTDLMACLASNL